MTLISKIVGGKIIAAEPLIYQNGNRKNDNLLQPKKISPQEIVKMPKKLVPLNRKQFTPANIKKHVFAKLMRNPNHNPKPEGLKNKNPNPTRSKNFPSGTALLLSSPVLSGGMGGISEDNRI